MKSDECPWNHQNQIQLEGHFLSKEYFRSHLATCQLWPESFIPTYIKISIMMLKDLQDYRQNGPNYAICQKPKQICSILTMYLSFHCISPQNFRTLDKPVIPNHGNFQACGLQLPEYLKIDWEITIKANLLATSLTL